MYIGVRDNGNVVVAHSGQLPAAQFDLIPVVSGEGIIFPIMFSILTCSCSVFPSVALEPTPDHA